MKLFRILINPIYRFFTTIRIYASDYDIIWEGWDSDYKPYGYMVKKYPKDLENGWVMMIVCKDLIK